MFNTEKSNLEGEVVFYIRSLFYSAFSDHVWNDLFIHWILNVSTLGREEGIEQVSNLESEAVGQSLSVDSLNRGGVLWLIGDVL